MPQVLLVAWVPNATQKWLPLPTLPDLAEMCVMVAMLLVLGGKDVTVTKLLIENMLMSHHSPTKGVAC